MHRLRRYEHKGAWLAPEVTQEEILVKGGASRTIAVERTVHGSVLQDSLVRLGSISRDVGERKNASEQAASPAAAEATAAAPSAGTEDKFSYKFTYAGLPVRPGSRALVGIRRLIDVRGQAQLSHTLGRHTRHHTHRHTRRHTRALRPSRARGKSVANLRATPPSSSRATLPARRAARTTRRSRGRSADRPNVSYYTTWQARDYAEFDAALSYASDVISLNFSFASAAGHIGYVLCGRVPLGRGRSAPSLLPYNPVSMMAGRTLACVHHCPARAARYA